VLESTWQTALAGGVANSGNQQLADRIWRQGARGDIDVRMAYYGTPFIDPGAQGAPDVDLDTQPLPDDVDELTEQLAMTWLHTAADAAKDPSDRRQAHNDLDIITGTIGQAQGPPAPHWADQRSTHWPTCAGSPPSEWPSPADSSGRP
jgi:hypothetical protein